MASIKNIHTYIENETYLIFFNILKQFSIYILDYYVTLSPLPKITPVLRKRLIFLLRKYKIEIVNVSENKTLICRKQKLPSLSLCSTFILYCINKQMSSVGLLDDIHLKYKI